MRLPRAKKQRNTLLGPLKNDIDPWGLRVLERNSIDVFVDLGANCGVFSMLARFLNPKARVIALEPYPDSLQMLRDNICYLDVETYQWAYGPDGQSSLMAESPAQVAITYQPCETGGVRSVSLATLVDELGIWDKRIFWKVDIEGEERHLLDPVETNILRLAECVSIECHHRFPHHKTMFEYREWARTFSKTHRVAYNFSNRFGGIHFWKRRYNELLDGVWEVIV